MMCPFGKELENIMMRLCKKMIDKYKSISVAAKASLWYTICNVFQKGIVLLATPIFTRLMSKEEYGLYTIYQSWYAIIIIFATMNMFYSAYNNILTKYDKERDIATSSMQGLASTITLVLICTYCMWYKGFNSLLKLPTIIMIAIFIQILFEPALNFWLVRQRYEYKYKGAVVVTLAISVIGTLLSVIFVIFSDEKGISRILVFALTQAVFGLVFYFIHFIKGKKYFSKKFWGFTLGFCIPLVPHYLSFTILNQADRIMISDMVGKGEAAVYAVAYTIAMMVQILTQAITNSLTPYTYQSIKKQNYTGIKRTSSLLLILMAGLCMVVMLFAPEVLTIVAPDEYAPAIYIMPPVIASSFYLFLYPLFSNVEFYYEKTKFIMIASSLAAICNLLLNYIFIPIYGYYAAGFTTLFCYMAISFGHYIFYKKILKDNSLENEELYDVKTILITSTVVFIFSIICMYLYKYIVIRYAMIVMIAITIYLFRVKIFEIIKNLKEK